VGPEYESFAFAFTLLLGSFNKHAHYYVKLSRLVDGSGRDPKRQEHGSRCFFEDPPLDRHRLEIRTRLAKIRTAWSSPPGANPIIESYHHSPMSRALVYIACVSV
jgi:hypothetical protein